jgi:hypothetical protein
MVTITFLISIKTPSATNVSNLQETLGWLIEEAADVGVWDVDGMRVALPLISDVAIKLTETT